MNNIAAKTKICMVIGDPVEHSLSPQMHNAGFEELGIDDEFVFVACCVKINELDDFVKGVKSMHIRGISCTIPHKTEITQYVDEMDEIAKKIGAVNTIINHHGILKGFNTDWLGVVNSIQKITDIKDKKVAVLGAGGAAKAAIYGITQKGGTVTIFNRSNKKAELLAKEFHCSAKSLDNVQSIKEMDIIFNATPVGMYPHENESPLEKEYITNHHIVFDAIYTPYETQLLKDAKEQGAKIIHGTEMLLYQGTEQFKLFTGHDAPVDVMRNTLNSLVTIH